MTDPREHESLVAAVTSAWRARDPDGRIEPHPAWADLDEDGRREAHEATVHQRALEAATDPGGLSATAHAVLDRIRRSR